MNLAELERKLIAAARSNPPSDHVPYAFEKRVMARLAERPAVDVSAVWVRALWRAAASCLVVVVLLSVWSFLSSAGGSASKDLSQQFEKTLLAAVDQEGDYF
jgi:hypothetical protein